MGPLITALRLCLSLAAIFIIGLPITWLLLAKRQNKIPILEAAALSFGIGTGLLTLGMLFVAMANRPLSPSNILISYLILILILTGYLAGARKRFAANPFHPRKVVVNNSATSMISRSLSLLEIFLLTIIVFEVLFVFSEALLYPMSAHDPLSHWGLKAKAFFLQRQITFRGFTAHNYYPLQVPLSETWIYLGLGSVNDGLVKILFPLFLVSLVILFYYFQRRMLFSRTHALLFTAFLITCGGQLIHFSTIAYADVPLTFFYTVATLSLYFWMVSPQDGRYLILSGLFSGIATWTKLEGAVLVGINSIVLAIYIFVNWRNKRVRKVAPLVAYFSPIILFFVPWFIFRQVHGVTASNEHLGELRIELFPLVITQLVHALLEYKKWGILWLLALVTGGLTLKKNLSPPTIYLFMIVVLNVASLIGTYVVTSSQNPASHMQASVQRLLLHFVPSVVFLMSIQADEVVGSRIGVQSATSS